jgi:hypothetical protein
VWSSYPQFSKICGLTAITLVWLAGGRSSNANYGFIFTFWDAMFRTKHSVSFHSLKNLETGIDDIQMPANFHIKELLANPFK